MADEQIHLRFEDAEDMMEHAHEKIEDAVYFYCLCTKMMMRGADPEIIRALLVQLVAEEFDDVNRKLIPYLEVRGNETTFYGLIQKDF